MTSVMVGSGIGEFGTGSRAGAQASDDINRRSSPRHVRFDDDYRRSPRTYLALGGAFLEKACGLAFSTIEIFNQDRGSRQ
ncbi:hypothetical protein [Methylobacterium indicum]|uniref:hypothetical protein n=1 Tax=Methylobacterium indicum TaxID=1775910 RepID=UPI000A669132|nr:hypothetical protein [Methylobacterium indicum]